jgi:hypothetical protein
MRLLFVLLLAPLALACEHRPPAPGPADTSLAPVPFLTEPTPPPPPAPVVKEKILVPRGCDINLAGLYHLAQRPSPRYRLEDDGVRLIARPLDAPDGGNPEAMTMALDRTGKGFVGLVVGSARTAGGTDCPVSFKASIVACDAQGVTVRSDDAASLDEACHQRRQPGSATEKLLLRD